MQAAPTGMLGQNPAPPPAPPERVQVRGVKGMSSMLTFLRSSCPLFVTASVMWIGWPGPEAFTHDLLTVSEGERGTEHVALSDPVAVDCEHSPVPVAVAVSLKGPHWLEGGV